MKATVRRFRANYRKQDIFLAVPDAVAKLRGFTLAGSDEDSFSFKAGVSMNSWGELVKVEVKELSEGCELRISSQCKLPTLDDNGKNSENVSKVIHAICEELKAYSPIN
ncbi:hypothetical protein CLOSTMETH_02811 [[Clostridium] methylpentosum DSM 5476]|uniref:Uncharacterized protein n=1 Tax=[Clostridium] methylpentosum DSM 5476 TaxID=537013 RepID=C0EG19_9FIRM|nr:hypothetical protein CLOSTMETH_02811 [[Clostridium] methylpentosum DSM 5476]MDY3988239.1 hypothetical protein [Massilioclostridium sp.]MEE1491740.1 hypothetical protein [Massilioclostridium sp.]